MQYPDCENPSIQVTSGSNQSLNSGYGMSAYEGMAKINLHSQSKLIITSVNQF